MEYLVIFQKSGDDSIWVQVPDLPGCFSFGDTVDEARGKIKEAIELHIETLKEEVIAVPEVHHLKAELVAVET